MVDARGGNISRPPRADGSAAPYDVYAALMRVPALVAVLRGPELVYEFANDAYCRSAGYDASPVGRRYGESRAATLGGDYAPILRRVLETGEAVSGHEAAVRPQGSDVARYYDYCFQPVLGADGAPQSVLIHAADVTESVVARHRVEEQNEEIRRQREALRASEERLRKVVECNMIGIVFWDRGGQITDGNDAFLSMVGYTREDVAQRRLVWSAMTPPEWQKERARAAAEIHARGVCTPYEKELLRKDGSRVPVLVGAAAFDAEVTGGAGFVLDISERKWIEEAHREAEAVLHTVVANAPVMLFALDRQLVFTLHEGREASVLGRAAGSLVGKQLRDLPDCEEAVAYCERALRGEEFSAAIEYGSVHWDARYGPLRDARGEITGVIGVATNVTARVEAERARAKMEANLLQLQKLESLGVLAGGIAHDFNNLLTGILGSASVALLDLDEEDPARAPVGEVIATARHAADLTRQLLAYAGRARFEVRALDLSAHVRDIADLLASTLPKKVQLDLALAAGLPTVEADVAQLQQVIMNLVINAAEAIGDARGTVTVSTGSAEVDVAPPGLVSSDELAPGQYVFVRVQDTGAGMDEGTRARIFDPFFTTKFAGRGLGLAAVLGIVRAHRGGIALESEPGRGATFTVLFPVSGKIATPRPRGHAAALRGSGTVLIVDDEPSVRAAARRALEHFGFDVLEAEDGRRGLDAFRAARGKVTALLVDLTMPELNGVEMVRELRAIDPRVPVLLSSGYGELEAKDRVDDPHLSFLQKPYTPDELASALEAALRTREIDAPERP